MPSRFSLALLTGYGALNAFRNRSIGIVSALVLMAGAGLAQAEPVEILALGDSLTQGYGLAQGDGLVPQLQAWLDRQGAEATLINAGVSGDTTSGGRARLGWSLTDTVDAVIVELGGNDLLRGMPPAAARENLDAILAEVTGRGLPVLLVGLSAPGNYGTAYKADFDAIWPELSAKYHTLLLPDLLAPIAALTPEERAAQGLMQGDNIHPSAAGVKLVVEALGPKVMELIEEAQRD
ncbi:arylesterase [Paenirhodobacter populi]|uniref:Arylesterase n=1 Tax=Paenirhodobacter populi TaxID=2306993 RepID=A0A443JH37_9RHOB|nr:arylesterase [Sinirhodobacter populi]RWR19798.1 arylesterase [Sinirhodobacter populi]